VANPRALVFNPYLATLGGGEQYMFGVAEVLADSFDVVIGGRAVPLVTTLAERGLPTYFEMIRMPDRKFGAASALFDLTLVMANDIPPPSRAPHSLLMAQFPFARFRPWRPLRAVRRAKILSRYRTLVNSDFTREWTKTRWKIDATVVSPPINRGVYEPASKRPVMLSIGRFSRTGHSKRHDVMIDAFCSLPDEVKSSWSLVLAGASPSDRKSMSHVASLRERAAGENIEFAVNVAQERLNQYLRDASIYWHAAGFGRSPSHPEQAEHFGMATVEAMSWGAVPIVYDDGGQHEIVTEDVGLRWSSVGELCNETMMLIADPERRNTLAAGAAAASERYSSQAFAKRLRSIVADELNEEGARRPGAAVSMALRSGPFRRRS
jgi:glycosyltransferase involved in cell wall biosynthesis